MRLLGLELRNLGTMSQFQIMIPAPVKIPYRLLQLEHHPSLLVQLLHRSLEIGLRLLLRLLKLLQLMKD